MSMDALRERRRLVASLAMVAATLSWGCGTTRMTNTARTGTEQLLLTNAWDQALQQIDFRPLVGVPTYLDTTHLTADDQGWVVSSLRQAMLAQGVLLRDSKEEAQWVVEPRIGAYGTDDYNLLVGIPQTNIPFSMPGVPAGTIPEVPLIKKSDQHAVSKLALFAYDRASGQIVWKSGTVLGLSNDKNVFVGGLGPIQSGSIRGGTEFVGVKIPMIAEQAEQAPHEHDGRSLPFADPGLRTPGAMIGRDEFVP